MADSRPGVSTHLPEAVLSALDPMIFHLEMSDRHAFCPKALPPGFAVERLAPADPAMNRRFYQLVGAPWRWTDKLQWSDGDWSRYVCREELGTWVARLGDDVVGYFELECQHDGDVEIKYLGLLPDFIGRGLGGPLLSQAVEAAWNLGGTRRVWVHTCTDDHEHALGNYLKRRFTIFKTEPIERQA